MIWKRPINEEKITCLSIDKTCTTFRLVINLFGWFIKIAHMSHQSLFYFGLFSPYMLIVSQYRICLSTHALICIYNSKQQTTWYINQPTVQYATSTEYKILKTVIKENNIDWHNHRWLEQHGTEKKLYPTYKEILASSKLIIKN